MPFLRFSRDKRGYENTYVLHTFRREGSTHPRLLYWFRTPPGVRVGRYPLDERAIRAIEESNPNLSFDWSQMLKVRPAPPAGDARRTKSTKSRKEPRRKRRSASDQKSGSVREVTPPESVEPPASVESFAEAAAEPVDDLVAGVVGPEGGDVDEIERSDEPWQHPVVTLMGEEMLARLRARYAEIKVRIAEKRTDPETRVSVSERAEGLNPDRWKTTEDAVRGIERFQTEADAIKAALGRRPPRPRKI